MTATRPLHTVAPYQDSVEQGRLILRDGSTASFRVSRIEDRFAVREFYRLLSPASRRFRFFTETKPGENVIDPLCDSSDPKKQMTLLVFRHGDQGPRIIAAASYIAHSETKAEFAVAVDDAFHGRGLGGLMLERLSVLAGAQGFDHFIAMVDPANQSMLDTFRNSGFAIKETYDEDGIAIDIAVTPREESVARAELRDRMFTKASMHPFFHPRSVAVVGASRDPKSFGHRIMEALVASRFNGPVYPVNPQAQVICSTKAFPKVSAIPDPVDLAIIAVHRDSVMGVIDDCALRGVRAVIVISAGFAELDEDGAKRQQALVEKVRGHGMRLVGPNCLGVLNTDPHVHLNATFSPSYPPHGHIALSSQSGALGLAILSLARQRNLGLSMFISMGNKADVTGNDLLQYWEDDVETDVILLYLESFGNPRRFARIARRISKSKPIVCVKSGRHRRLSDAAVDALFHQTGVIRANSLEEMFDVAALLGNQPLPAGNRVGIVTNSHGSGVLCMDTCEASGLAVTAISDKSAARLKSMLPEGSKIGPLINLSASASPADYQHTVECALLDENIDALIAMCIPVGLVDMDAVLNAFGQAVANARARGAKSKPVLAVMMTGDSQPGLLEGHGEKIPRYLFPETAARTLATAVEYEAWRSGPQGEPMMFEDAHPQTGREFCRAIVAARGPSALTSDETRMLLAHFGANPSGENATSASPHFAIEVTEDPLFGPLIRLVFHGQRGSKPQEISVRVTPLTDRDATEMAAALGGLLMQENGCGKPELRALEELLLRISLLVEEVPDVRSFLLDQIAITATGIVWTPDNAVIQIEPSRRGQPQRAATPA